MYLCFWYIFYWIEKLINNFINIKLSLITKIQSFFLSSKLNLAGSVSCNYRFCFKVFFIRMFLKFISIKFVTLISRNLYENIFKKTYLIFSRIKTIVNAFKIFKVQYLFEKIDMLNSMTKQFLYTPAGLLTITFERFFLLCPLYFILAFRSYK